MIGTTGATMRLALPLVEGADYVTLEVTVKVVPLGADRRSRPML